MSGNSVDPAVTRGGVIFFGAFIDIIFDKGVIKMTERIEKVARVKAVENDVARKFDGQNHPHSKNSAFLSEYRRFLNRGKNSGTGEHSGAYTLELTNEGLPALFYFGDRDIRALLN